jgi:aspartyl protease family protein
MSKNSSTAMGTTMLIIAWVILLGLLGLAFSAVLNQQENPNQSPNSSSNSEQTTLVLQANRKNHYVTTGVINGQPVKLLLDTGATDVVIPLALATDLALSQGRATTARTANGNITVYQTVIPSLTIDGIVFTNLRASLNPAMTENDAILLGMSALKQVDIAISNNALTLRQARPR